MKSLAAFVTASLILSSAVRAETFHVTSVRDLDFAENQGSLEEALKGLDGGWRGPFERARRHAPAAQLRLPEPLEAYMTRMPDGENPIRNSQANLTVAFRLDNEDPVTGYVDLRVPGELELRPFKFTLDPGKLAPATKGDYEAVRRTYYQTMGGAGVPGAAWFRHLGCVDRDKDEEAENPERQARRTERDLSPTFAFFSGSRAIAENLALDRDLILARSGKSEDVPISGIKGITIKAIDWKARLPEGAVDVDPLAHVIPHDQHALFAGSMAKLLQLVDLVEQDGAPILQSFDVRNPYRNLPSRYLAQLGLDDRAFLRGLPVKSLAITGGDPFLPSGSDVAILFETDEPETLFRTLADMIGTKAATLGAQPVDTDDGQIHRGYQNRTRRFSSHVMRATTFVAVANSASQISRLAATQNNTVPNLGGTDEFTFFRARYRRGDVESAFVFLSDATIRRWCGPRVRIAASRRNRALAALGELTSRNARGIELGSEFEPLLGKASASGTDQPVISETHGSLGFLTPVSELDFHSVTAAEKAAYENWRRGYEDGWARVFDPIAVQFTLGENAHSMDLTVLPLTVDSDYREWIAFAGKASLSPMARNPHDASVLFASFAVDSASPAFREFDTQLVGALPGLKVKPLAWVGQSLTVFLERDFFWRAMEEFDGRRDGDFGLENWAHIPLGLRVESKSGINLALFLTALKGFAETAAPGLTRWETRKHADRPYVAIIGNASQTGTDASIYYAPMPKALLVALDEGILKRAIEREKNIAKLDAKTVPVAKHAFLGTSPQFLSKLADFSRNTPLNVARRNQSWLALPILNAWHRRGKDADPASFHRRMFGDDLTCPGGKGYRWNAEAMTMESVAYGYPANPRDDGLPVPLFDRFNAMTAGLGFVDDGLRLRAALSKRESAAVEPAPSGKELGAAKGLSLTRTGATQTWKLESPHADDHDTMELEVLAPGKFGDTPTVRTRMTSSGGEEPDSTVVMEETLGDSGLTFVGQTSDEEVQRFTKPLVELPPTLVQGKVYRYEYEYISVFEDAETRNFGEYTLVPVGLETVTTETSVFENCVRVEGTHRAVAEGYFTKSHEVIWYKEGLGPVKSIINEPDGVYVSEVTAYEIPEEED